MVGSTLGNYKILEKLGAGGQGTVYKAVDSKLGRTVVIKVLPEEFLAKLLEDDAARTSGIHHTELTEVGISYGTATYAAPEQARGDRVDSRADIFSTGVLLYEMLTGTWPFKGKTAVDVRHAVLHEDP